jgi:glutamate 5-kinase
MTDLLRQEIAATTRMMVVKVGTRVLTGDEGRLDPARIGQLADQIHQVISSGRKVALVSSGAVGSGMGRLGLKTRPADLAHLQAVAAVGQSVLVEAYEQALERYGHHAAQILLTADDLNHRTRYLNARNTILTLFDLGAVPIINENDTVAVEELQTTFGDNDHLAAIVTNLIQAPLLILLSDVEGLYDGNPREAGSRLIPTVSRIDAEVRGMVRDTTGGQLSKGGMTSKLNAARIATSAGESVIITSGRTPNVLPRIIAGEPVGTLFLARGQSVAARKRWIGFTVRPHGHLVLDPGARHAIECDGRSLLPIGIVDVVGRFSKADVVALRDQNGVEFARGLTNYTADEVRKIKGLKSSDINGALGYCPYQEVIHRDNMVVTS